MTYPFLTASPENLSNRPKDHRTSSNVQAVQHELVFDIDMTDYDEVRTCCQGAEVCPKCWKFMVIACHIIDSALREDFAFEHILWVFSGRRGIHCWVCDKVARHLDTKNRGAVAEYFNIMTTQNHSSRVTITGSMHHSVKRAMRFIEPIFEEICLSDQNLFASEEGKKKLLELITDEAARKDLEVKVNGLEDPGDSKAVWDCVKKYLTAIRTQKGRRALHAIEEIQLSLLYPRIDIAVSKTTNHLLKAPFCVHPKTGKICVPINPSAVAKFDPTTVPTIRQLLKEIDQFDSENADETEAANRIKVSAIDDGSNSLTFTYPFFFLCRAIARLECTKAFASSRNSFGSSSQVSKGMQNCWLAMPKWSFNFRFVCVK